MKIKCILLSLFVIVSLIFTSCDNKDIKTEELSKSPKKVSPDTTLSNIVYDWNQAINSRDVGKLSSLYSNKIFYFGSVKDKNSCIENVLALFKKYPDYYQQVFGGIQIEKISESEFKFSFVKRVSYNLKTEDYPSYMFISKEQETWKITKIGDLVTDKNMAKGKEVNIPKNAIKGDYNGDGILDYAWLVPPKLDEEGMDCIGDCFSFIEFSDPEIQRIKVNKCISGTPDNLGDLNRDGTDEIGISPGWFQSCWSNYYVWTFSSNQWVFAVQPFPTHCDQWREGIAPIEIDYNRSNYVTITYSEYTNDAIETKKKSVLIK